MKYFIVLTCFFFSVAASAQVRVDAEEAFRISSETNKPVLLIFAGSDWCAPCMRFEKKVLLESSFQDFANENIIVLKADFPQRKKLSQELEKQNEALAEQYNPKGVFPQLLVLGVDRRIISTLSYSNQSALDFISEIKQVILK